MLRLEPHLVNLGKRLVKSPKVNVRDSGLLHALLGVPGARELQGHPVAGGVWEGFVVEQVAAALPAGAQMGFYRTTVRAALDLVIEHRGKKVGIEIKFSVAPKPARGFWQSLKDLRINTAWVVAPVTRRDPLAHCVDVIPLHESRGFMAALGWRDRDSRVPQSASPHCRAKARIAGGACRTRPWAYANAGLWPRNNNFCRATAPWRFPACNRQV